MIWAEKERDWNDLIQTIQSELDANREIIPKKHIDAIQHYLEHGEYSMAFEYLYLEIMERPNSHFTLGVSKASEIALFFDLDDENECMIDGKFWPKFNDFLNRVRKSGYPY